MVMCYGEGGGYGRRGEVVWEQGGGGGVPQWTYVGLFMVSLGGLYVSCQI